MIDQDYILYNVFSKFKYKISKIKPKQCCSTLKLTVLDLPRIFDEDFSNLMQVLSSLHQGHSIFQSAGIKAILDFKWNHYFKYYFFEDLVIFLFFLICDTYNSVHVLPLKFVHQKDYGAQEGLAIPDEFFSSFIIKETLLFNFLNLLFFGYKSIKEFREVRVRIFNGNWLLVNSF